MGGTAAAPIWMTMRGRYGSTACAMFGNVNLNRRHGDGGSWPHPGDGEVLSGVGPGLSPEDANRVAVDLGEELFDLVRGIQ
jgi:hypothetical protein